LGKFSDIFNNIVLLDERESKKSLYDQAIEAIQSASSVFYQNSESTAKDLNSLKKISDLLKCNDVPLFIYNDIMLAKIFDAYGVVFKKPPSSIDEVRKFLGTKVLLGSIEPWEQLDFALVDYGPDKKVKSRKIHKPWGDEFTLIKKLLINRKRSDWIIVNPGEDDSCLLKEIKKPVISTDTQKENVHFRRDWQTPYEIGFKAVTITLSDLAASFAKPVVLFINLSLPKNLSERYLSDIYDGVNEALDLYKCALGGGNISSGNEFSLDLFTIGSGLYDFHPKRGNARKGELLCCTGPLGEAKAGLNQLINRTTSHPRLIERFKKPTARFDLLNVLSDNGVRCVTDVSDGLIGDARHIARASELSIKFNHKSIPISNDLLLFCSQDKEKALGYIFEGGEDYELLFSCTKENFKKICELLSDVYVVGEFIEKDSNPLVNVPDAFKSFNHGN
jgi:thiamine-monophosphate kinase